MDAGGVAAVVVGAHSGFVGAGGLVAVMSVEDDDGRPGRAVR